MSGSTSANLQQQKAIDLVDGPLLIVAGPGSGKTFTLVERVVSLITQHGVEAEDILVSTFTDKAAHELLTRISNRLMEMGSKVNPNSLAIGTIHSICLRLLEDYREFTRLKRNFILMDQFDQQYMLYQRLSEYRELEGSEGIIGASDKTSAWHQAQTLTAWINKVSEEALDVDQLATSEDEAVAALGRCYQLYQQQLEEQNALDFSTIQSETLRLLTEHLDVLDEVRGKYRYMMIDEYQDTNAIQEIILMKISEKHQNICVVGDDDQGLYRFRGATIRNILEFPGKFPDGKCQQVHLTTNYRSDARIIELYNDWMTQTDWGDDGGNRFRFDKVVEPVTPAPADYPTVFKVSGENDADNWGDEIIDFLNDLRTKGILKDWNQAAFLFRSVSNAKVVNLANKLEDAGIPIYAPRSKMYFDREEVRLMIGALIFLFPQFPEARRLRTGNSMAIWDYYDHTCFAAFAAELRKPENKLLLTWCRDKAIDHKSLSANADYAFSGLFYDLLQFPLFSRYIREADDSDVRDSRPARNLAMFSRLLTKFEYLHHISVLTPEYLDKNIRSLFNQYLRFLYDGGIEEYEEETAYAPSGCLSFMTIHQSKGLEFPLVMVGSMEAVPRKQYTELDELLQQRYFHRPPFEPIDRTKTFDFWRLFYTAFSRAQNMLVLTCQENAPSGRGQRNVPSRYLKATYDSLQSWRDMEFDPAKIDLSNIKPINIKNEYSFTSHILIFEGCSQQYRFFKELEFSPVRRSNILFGTLVHQTIEDIHKTVLRGEPEKVTEERIEGWFKANYHHLTKRERVYLTPVAQQIALDHVLRYTERERSNWGRLQEAEVEIALMKEHYILKGQIDLVRGEHGTVEIIDFKSEKKPDIHTERERLDRYKRQLQIYAHLIEEQVGQKVSKMHLYYTGEESGSPYVTYPHNPVSIEETINTVDAVVERIEHKDFGLDERPPKLCPECDMRAYCDQNFVKRGS